MSSYKALDWVRKTSQEQYLRDINVIKSARFIEVNKEVEKRVETRKAGKLLLDGFPCVFWYAVENAIYGMVTYHGRYTGDVVKVAVDGNFIGLPTHIF